MPLIAAVTAREPVRRILRHLGEPALPPPISPARSPPEEQALDWDQTSGAASSGCDPSFEPPPEFQFDQTVVGNRCAANKPRRLARRARRSPLAPAPVRPHPKAVVDASGRRTVAVRSPKWPPRRLIRSTQVVDKSTPRGHPPVPMGGRTH
jgi:hypothetical protein